MSFIFGEGTGGVTQADLERRRKVAEQLGRSVTGRTPRDVGEGIAHIGNALLYRSMQRRTKRDEDNLRSDFETKFKEVAPNANISGIHDLMNSPFANAGHKNVLQALLKGAPNFADGGTMKRRGQAVVGEFGPEVVTLPEGAQVDPIDFYSGVLDPADADFLFELPEPTQADAIARIRAGEDPTEVLMGISQGLQGYDPASQQRLLNNPQDLAPPPEDMREIIGRPGREGRGGGASGGEYQVAPQGQYDPMRDAPAANFEQHRLWLQQQIDAMSPEERERLMNAPMPGAANSRRDGRRGQGGPLVGGAGVDAIEGNPVGDTLSGQPAFGEDAPTARSLAQSEIAQRDAMNGLSSVLEELQANPDLLNNAHTLTGRGKTALLRLRDRMGVDAWDLSPEEEASLGDTTAYKQELLTRVNQYIKDITGAQVGQGQETQRLMAVQANEGDSPTQVIAKITNALELARLDIARRRYMQRADGPAPSDRELREFLKSRGRELYDAAIAGGLTPDAARMQAAQALSEEFGL